MHEVLRVREIAVVELQADGTLVDVTVDAVDALGVKASRLADDAVPFVPLVGVPSHNPRRQPLETKTSGAYIVLFC